MGVYYKHRRRQLVTLAPVRVKLRRRLCGACPGWRVVE
jgi:hypothetical protein